MTADSLDDTRRLGGACTGSQDPPHRARGAQHQHPVLRLLSPSGTAHHRRGAQGGGPRRAHLLPASRAPGPRRHRLGRPDRDLHDDVDRTGRLRAGGRTAGRRTASDHRRPAPDLRARRSPAARRLRRPRRRRGRAHARADRGALGRTRARERPGAVVLAGRAARPQRPARPLRRPRHPADARLLAHRRLGAHAGDADAHEPRLSLRLHVLHRHDDVRAQLPLPQRGERDRRARGSQTEVGLLLRRQLRRQQATHQRAPADDDRPRPQDEVAGPGTHRCGQATRSC